MAESIRAGGGRHGCKLGVRLLLCRHMQAQAFYNGQAFGKIQPHLTPAERVCAYQPEEVARSSIVHVQIFPLQICCASCCCANLLTPIHKAYGVREHVLFSTRLQVLPRFARE